MILLVHRGKNNVQKDIIPHDKDYIFNFDRYYSNILNLIRTIYIALFKIPKSEVVVVNSDHGLFLGFFLKNIRGMHIVCHLNGPVFYGLYWDHCGEPRTGKSFWQFLKFKVLQISCDQIVTISSLLKKDALRTFPHVSVKQLKTYTEHQHTALMLDFYEEKEIRNFVLVADRAKDVSLVKGVDIFIRASAQFKMDFHLVGRQSEFYANRGVIVHPKLSFSEIVTLGECFVIPSRYDAFGRIGLEMAYCKKLVISSKMSGFGSELEKIAPELCFDPDDVSLSKCIERVMCLSTGQKKSLKEAVYQHFYLTYAEEKVRYEYRQYFGTIQTK